MSNLKFIKNSLFRLRWLNIQYCNIQTATVRIFITYVNVLKSVSLGGLMLCDLSSFVIAGHTAPPPSLTHSLSIWVGLKTVTVG